MRRRMLWVLGIVAVGIMAVSAYALRGWVVEQWYLSRLDSADRAVQEQAAARLADLESSRAVAPLLELQLRLQEASPKVTGGRMLDRLVDSPWSRAISQIGSHGLRELYAGYKQASLDNRPVVEKLIRPIKVGPQDAPILVDVLADEQLEPFWRAVSYDFSHFGTKAQHVAPRLLELTRSSRAEIRRYSLASLRPVVERPGAIVDRLIEMLDDPDAAVRSEVAYTIGHFGPEVAAVGPRLARQRGDPDVRAALMVAWALDRLASDEPSEK